MSLAANKQRLTALTKDLLLRWDDTKASWLDAKAQEFERRFLAELVAGVDKTATVIDQLDKLVAKVRSDCE